MVIALWGRSMGAVAGSDVKLHSVAIYKGQ
jgi:hypothetical protein